MKKHQKKKIEKIKKMSKKIGAVKIVAGGVLVLVALGISFSVFASGVLATTTVYDATPPTLPPNVTSIGFEATSTSQLGDYVHLAGTDRTLNSVTVTMSDWAVYSDYANDPIYGGNSANWSHPITINIYSNHLTNGVPDTLLASKTQAVTIPWRPAADPTCPVSTFWKASDGNCYNGIAFNATVDMSSLGLTLPDDVIVGVVYNTENYGPQHIGNAGPYNLLNVGTPSGTIPTVGRDDSIYGIFWDTTFRGRTAGFKLDNSLAPNGTVALKIAVSSTPTMPTSTDECRDNGWKTFGSSFKNQGDCMSFITTSGKNTPTN